MVTHVNPPRVPARRQGLLGLTAEVLKENEPMMRVFEKMGLKTDKKSVEESWDLRLRC